MPRFVVEPEAEALPTDHDDLGFATTSAWDAPASAPEASPPAGEADGAPPPAGTSAVDGASPAAGSAGVADVPGASGDATSEGAVAGTAPSTDPESDPHGELNGRADGRAELADPEVAAPVGLDPSEPDRDDSADDLGPPAPFFAPAPAAPSERPGEAAGVGAAHPETAPEVPGEPDGATGDPEAGQTLPFWSVPSQPEPSGRRWSLPSLRRPTLRRPRLRRPTRAGLVRALPIVLLVIGGLLLVEGALTVLWKEPFSALFAAQTQNALGDDLEALERRNAAEAAQAARSQEAAERYQRRRAVALNRDTGIGSPTGRLRIKKLGLNEVVVQGTDDTTIQAGPGHYTQTPLPGQKGNWTVGIAGHRTTYGAPFRRINELKRGDEIVYTLPYGRFVYEVEGTKIVDDSETGVFVPKGYNRIALTACHPLYSAAQRIIAYGKLKRSEPRGGARRAARS